MRDKILEHFITLTKIPHCSRKSEKLFDFLVDFAKKRGYEVLSDSAKNILVRSKNPKIALQAHYDMVCIGDAPNIEVVREKEWLRAKNSSLGADNGMAIAMMMLLMDMRREGEFLFTSDEEIGLVGASNLELELKSPKLLNLDFEDEGEVCIGCAGGADIKVLKKLEEVKPFEYKYRVEISGLKGGHSGVDIDKNIPNAIKLLASFLKNRDISIATFSGGERTNSIPTQAEAIISSKERIESRDGVIVEAIDTNQTFYRAKDIIDMINSFKNGVIAFNKKLNVVDRSVNLALIDLTDGELKIELSARGMSESGIDEVCKSVVAHFRAYGFETEVKGKYPSWEPKIGEFAKEVYVKMEESFGRAKFVAIHAGLECGVLSKKFPNMQISSIGPTILNPHSKSERVNIDSLDKTFNLILKLI